ncbi:MAG: phosphoribosyltransferase [Terriglobia bacterium]
MQFKPLYKAEQIARRLRALGKEISRDYAGEPIDLIGILDNSLVFFADLMRHIAAPLRCHFIHAEFRDVRDPAGYERREIFYTPEFDAAGKHVLVVDGVLQSGVTMDFLLKRLSLSHPKSLKTVVLVDKPVERKVPLEPDYYGFRLASNKLVVGYGLAWDGLYRNLPYVAVPAGKPVSRRPRARRRARPATQPARRRKARRR